MARLRQTRVAKLVRKVKASSYGRSLEVMPSFAVHNKYAGKPYGPHRKAIASSMKAIRKQIRAKHPRLNIGRGVESVNTWYLR